MSKTSFIDCRSLLMTPPSSICAGNLTFSSTIQHRQQGTWLSPSPRSHIQRHLMNRVLDQTTTVLSSFHRINTLASSQSSHRRDDPRAWPSKLEQVHVGQTLQCSKVKVSIDWTIYLVGIWSKKLGMLLFNRWVRCWKFDRRWTNTPMILQDLVIKVVWLVHCLWHK